MKRIIRGFFASVIFILATVFSLSLASAADINNTLHLNIQTTYSNGTIQNGTFTFAFNITDNSSSSCGATIYYNHTVSMTTDSRGIVSIYLPTSGSDAGNLSALNFNRQYYLCYYRDGTLKDVTQISRVPYSFRASLVNLSEVSVDSNFTIGNFYALLNRTGILTTTPQNALNVIGDINATTSIFSQGKNLSIGYDYALNATASGISWATANNGTLLNYSSALNGTLFNGTGTYHYNISNGFFNVTNGSGINVTFFNGTTARVGIGTTNPQAKLEVNGSLIVARTDASGNLLLNHNSGEGAYLASNTNSSDQSTANIRAIKLLINAYGTVAQTSPATAVGSGRTFTTRFYVPTGLVGTAGDIALGGSIDHTSSSYTGAVVVINGTTNKTGFNTTTPQNTLNVIGDINATTTIFSQGKNLSIGYDYALNATSSGISWATANNGTLLNYSSALNGTLAQWSQVGNGTVALTNVANTFGNFNQTFNGTTFFIWALLNRAGIGTTSPQNALNVIGDINATTSIFSQGKNLSIGYDYALNATASGISWATALNGTLFNGTGTYHYNISNGFFNVTNGSGINVTFIDGTTARVGIGTTAPQERFEVNGSLTVNRTDALGNLLLNHNSGEGAYLASNTNSTDRSTANIQAIKLLINRYGTVIQTSPATAAGSGRTFTTRFYVPTGFNGTAGDVVIGGAFDHTTPNYTGAAFIVKGTGHVGVNTTTPQNPLNVIGDINATGNSTHGLTSSNTLTYFLSGNTFSPTCDSVYNHSLVSNASGWYICGVNSAWTKIG